MCSMCSNQCAQCAATNVLTVGQSICIKIYPALFMQQCGNQNSQYQINSTSYMHSVYMQQIEIRCALSAILLCGVLSRVQQCQVLWRWGTDVFMFFSGCVAAYLRGMGKYNCGSSVRLHYRKKVSYYEWQVQVS